MEASACVLIRESSEVSSALTSLGISRELVERVAVEAIAARADTLPVDPLGTAGWEAYRYGVRHLRLGLRPTGKWRDSHAGNVESVVNDDHGIQLIFQNVDRACDPLHAPQAISGKGSESRRQVAAGQLELFTNPQTGVRMLGTAPVVWAVCVEASDTVIRAEVSCPRAFEGHQFDGFNQRIFVVDRDSDSMPVESDNAQPIDDGGTLEVVVNRKR